MNGREHVWIEELQREMPVYSIEDVRDLFRTKYPEGLTVTVQDESIENLRLYATEPQYNEEDFIGYPAKDIQMLATYGELKAELRLPPEKFDLLYADENTYQLWEMSEKGYDLETNSATAMMAEVEAGTKLSDVRLAVSFEPETLDCLYIEDRPFKEVAKVLTGHNIKTDRELREILALQNLYEKGLLPGKDIPEVIRPMMQSVEDDMQHMYGGSTPFREHPYYENDIHYKFSQGLQLKAEVLLMQRGILPTENHNLVVEFSNTRGDHWEAKWMLDHYSRNNSGQYEVERVGDRLVFSVHTPDPQRQVDLRHGLECSWAQKGVHRMPYEPIAEKAVIFVTKNGQVVDGYMNCNQFTEKNYMMRYEKGNVMNLYAHAGVSGVSMQTGEEVHFSKDVISLAKIAMQRDMADGLKRVDECSFTINGKDSVTLRGKVDGRPQLGIKLNPSDAGLVKAAMANKENFPAGNMERLAKVLAWEHFSELLKQSVEQDKTLKR